ncbi:hypothetical protein CRE_01486 [Caenorhabditis remanei]|uniref:Acyl_transf_3 domain-containing protein n=1 Tax=Caenorhabditis remanei TaxID=31234 RepID=E3NRZ3_CAERE|nr:hypothetical protein CRE_01486 [Caenorhabditis remanei]
MRQDIQCLRGIAIILVFLFHLFPSLFVNGFLGVDIFFVISGYLMAKNLTKNELKTLNDFAQFYYRRFRRILPLYYFVVFIIVVMVHLYLGDYLWDNNNRYSLASLFLVTNQLVIHDLEDYFNEVQATATSVHAFLHLWSLSVEMQFYLLVPFIFFGLQLLKQDYLKLIASCLITIFGFIAFAMILPKFAFNFMFLRLWQFSAGFVALFWSRIEKSIRDNPENKKEATESIYKLPFIKDDLLTVSLTILAICFLPSELNVMYFRPMVTMATAAVIMCKSQNNMMLSSNTLGYIGDISYVLYLVHWPLIVIFAPYSPQTYIFLTVTTLLSSIILHHIFEQKYLKMDWKTLVPFLFVLIMGNVFLQSSVRGDITFWNMTYTEDVQNIMISNKAQIPASWLTEEKRDECVEEPIGENIEKYKVFGYGSCVNGNGSLSIMLIGNSYALSFRNPLREQFGLNYSTFRYSSLIEGFGIYADTVTSRLSLEITRRQVARYKPDVLFIFARYYPSIRDPIRENDDYIQQMNDNIKFYEKFVKKIYILKPHPYYKWNFLNIFLQNVQHRPDDIESLHMNRREADKMMINVKKRFKLVKCSKCQFFDVTHLFVEDNKYLMFDRDQMLSYVDNTLHLTHSGLKVSEPELKRVAKEVMDTV